MNEPCINRASSPPATLAVVDLGGLSIPLQLFECVTYLCHPLRSGPDVHLRGLARDVERFLILKRLVMGARGNLATLTVLLRPGER